ncbi:MAG: prenyltransferase/squalene oxidase repeat-containing protein [Candidatus Brocadiia bacterium]
MSDEFVEPQESELDQYLEEEEPSWWSEFLADQVRRAPWWTISFLVHVIALLVMWKWPYRVMARDRLIAPIEVEMRKEEQEEPPPKEEPLPEPEKVEPDLEAPIIDAPPTPEPPTKEDPGPPLDLPPTNEMVKDVERPTPSIDPPSNTPVFAVRTKGPAYNSGLYSGRNRSGRNRALGGGGGTTKRAESSVMAGLYWLAKAQEPDGRWSCKKWDGSGEHDVGMTGLALLAFLGAGYTHTRGTFKDTVAKGLAWLKASQKDSGSFGWKTFYEQGIAAMAVSEAFAMTRSQQVGRMAQRAIDYIVQTQPDHGGFRYRGSVDKQHGDVSVTGWQIMAIKSGICAELEVPESAVEHSRLFLKNVSRDYGRSAYLVNSGRADAATSAIGMLCKQFMGGDFNDDIAQCADWLLDKGATVGRGKNKLVGDLYYTYYSVLAMFQMGDNSEYWLRWNKLFRDALVAQQVRQIRDDRGRFVRGSWDPANHQWGKRGGRVYSTAMAVLSLEVYYRFLPVYKPSR